MTIWLSPETAARLGEPIAPDNTPTEEVVARAIDEDLSQRHYGIPSDWDALPEYQRNERIFAARAAIRALAPKVDEGVVKRMAIELVNTERMHEHNLPPIEFCQLSAKDQKTYLRRARAVIAVFVSGDEGGISDT